MNTRCNPEAARAIQHWIRFKCLLEGVILSIYPFSRLCGKVFFESSSHPRVGLDRVHVELPQEVDRVVVVGLPRHVDHSRVYEDHRSALSGFDHLQVRGVSIINILKY